MLINGQNVTKWRRRRWSQYDERIVLTGKR
jgi:hypothetical protein